MNIFKNLTIFVCVLALFSGCAHKSKVKPSTGHIDTQNSVTAPPDSSPQSNQNNSGASIPKPVKNSTYLPPPKAKPKAQTYSVVVNEVPVKEILFALARESKLNIDIYPSIQGKVTLNAVDQTLPAILERLSKQVDLTYKMEGNVLTIAPDAPVLKTYRVDYVNMSRDTTSFMGVDGQISSSGQSSGAAGATSTTSGNGANNSSRTAVKSESQNHFWENLEKNIKELLAETDKEVIISRTGSSSQQTNTTNNQNAGNNNAANGNTNNNAPNNAPNNARTALQEREEDRNEYKTLFAANVISNREAGIISVRGTSKQHERVQEFLDKVLTSAKRQVLIEATIVEVRLNDSFQAGIDWSRLGNSATGNGFTFSQELNADNFSPGTIAGRASGTGLVAGYFNPVSALGNIAASVNLLKQFGNTKVLSSPKLMVLNNQTAVLKVVDNLVYFTVQAQQSQGAVGGGVLATVTTTPNTVPVGLVMSVTPQISDSKMVNVNVRPTISRTIGGRGVQDPNPDLARAGIASFIPVLQIREMESMLSVPSGNIAVLGGLMQDDISQNSDSVPGLSDVPGVGKAFRGRNDANTKTELVIFLRPTVIPNASLESEELSRFKEYLPSQQLQDTLDESAN